MAIAPDGKIFLNPTAHDDAFYRRGLHLLTLDATGVPLTYAKLADANIVQLVVGADGKPVLGGSNKETRRSRWAGRRCPRLGSRS